MGILAGKVAVITGGARGIGQAVANTFLEEGARVMLVDLDEDALKQTMIALSSDNVKYVVADVSSAEGVQLYLNESLKVFGKIDVFFNNAGIEGAVAPIAEYPDEVFDKVIAVNLKGVWLGCKYVLPKMEEGGSVIITSSVAGLKGFQGLGAYTATKHGVIGIMRVAALENADRRIRVNTVHPGPINTRMMRSIEHGSSPEDPGSVKAGFEATVPFHRYGEPKEIADLVLFLASDRSAYITGATMVADGGMMLT